MKRPKLLSHLAAHGCVLIRQGKRHSWYGNPANNRRTAVPRHSEIDDYLVKKICRDLGIPEP
jgi:mRNA interferase HicA